MMRTTYSIIRFCMLGLSYKIKKARVGLSINKMTALGFANGSFYKTGMSI